MKSVVNQRLCSCCKSIIITLIIFSITQSVLSDEFNKRDSTVSDPGKSTYQKGLIATLSLSIEGAILSGLKQNHALKIRQLEVAIEKTAIEEEKAAFDTNISIEVSGTDNLGGQISQNGALGSSASNRSEGIVEWFKKYPGGTSLGFGIDVARSRSGNAPNLFSNRYGFDLAYPLRQGRGSKVNLIAVKQAEIDTSVTEHQLVGFIISFVADIEKRYWNFFLARQELKIVRESLALAITQFEETRKKIVLGSLPESEQAAAEAEVSLRYESVINAETNLEVARIALLRLIKNNSDNFWEYPIELVDHPLNPEKLGSDPRKYLKCALAVRPDLLQAKLLEQRGELSLVQTGNGLLPQLDFFMELGYTGFAGRLSRTIQQFNNRSHDLTAGFRYQLPLGRRAARAEHSRNRHTLTQRKEAIQNLSQLIQEEVLTAWLEARRARQQIDATTKTVEKQKEKLRVEQVRFRVGKTTSFQIAQAQRDLASSQVAELKARVGYLKALVELYRLDSSLCARRKIMAGYGAHALMNGPSQNGKR
ncbi:TolC family protein [Candidatus Riflebacteria bacterium]